jgi:hypothetical protein
MTLGNVRLLVLLIALLLDAVLIWAIYHWVR